MRTAVDLVVSGDTLMAMADGEGPTPDGAVAIDGDRIVAVTTSADAAERFEPRATLGGPGTIVMPGLVNAHQHLTGDRLIRSTIPDDLGLDDALQQWALPSHTAHDGDLDELSATLSLVEAVTNGITFTVEAGTVGHPDRVLAAFDAVGVGGTLGTWGWDVDTGPFSGSTDEVVERQRATIELTRDHPTVSGWVTLVGHDLMSDALLAGATDLARELDTVLSFHMSSSSADPTAYLERTGRRPFEHLAALGVLAPNVVAAHAVHIDDAEIDLILDSDTAVVSCPWAYLRLGQGVTSSFHHPRLIGHGGRVALGCDSENAGDAIDVFLAARLFAGLAKDTGTDPSVATASRALRLATIDGARAIGMGHEIGSLEVGKRADVVVIDTTTPTWMPHADDPTLALAWASDGRAVRDVVAAGRVVVEHGHCKTVDHAELGARAQDAHRRLVAIGRAHPRNE